MTKKRIRPKTVSRQASRMATASEVRALRNQVRANRDRISAQREQITAQSHQITAQNGWLQQSRTDLDDALFRYADLYDFAPVGYLSLTGEGVICQANLPAAALLERARPDVIGVPMLRLIAAGERNGFRHF